MSRKNSAQIEDIDPQWIEFKDQHPNMFNFFNMKFQSYDDYTQQLEKYCNTYFQLLNKESSNLIKNNEALLERFKYDRLRLKCVHRGNARSNKVDNSRTVHTRSLECPFKAILVLKSK